MTAGTVSSSIGVGLAFSASTSTSKPGYAGVRMRSRGSRSGPSSPPSFAGSPRSRGLGRSCPVCWPSPAPSFRDRRPQYSSCGRLSRARAEPAALGPCAIVSAEGVGRASVGASRARGCARGSGRGAPSRTRRPSRPRRLSSLRGEDWRLSRARARSRSQTLRFVGRRAGLLPLWLFGVCWRMVSAATKRRTLPGTRFLTLAGISRARISTRAGRWRKSPQLGVPATRPAVVSVPVEAVRTRIVRICR